MVRMSINRDFRGMKRNSWDESNKCAGEVLSSNLIDNLDQIIFT